MMNLIAAYQPVTPQRGAEHLLAAIKTETRWLLLSAPARDFAIAEDSYCDDRRAFVSAWPAIRHRRMSESNLRGAYFYDLVADQASTLAHLIEIRRQREHTRRSQTCFGNAQ